MTVSEIERLRRDVLFQKEIGHSSKARVLINQMETVLDLAAKAAAMSELEMSAARRHMERSRRAGALA
jgi:hypothetical protein